MTSVEEQNIKKKRNGVIVWLIGIFLIIALAFLIYWTFYLRFHETTDDAYVKGNIVDLTVQMPGRPVAFFADDTDFVEEGQVLVLMDSSDLNLNFQKAKASLAQAVRQVKALAEKLEEARINVKLKQTLLDRSRFDYKNRLDLINIRAVSREELDHAKDNSHIAEFELQIAEHNLKTAQVSLGTTKIEDHPLIQTAKAGLREAYLNLRRCAILAPVTGIVARRNVEIGEWVNPARSLMSIIPLDNVWIEANFKETQLKYFRIGQPVSIWIDLYGDDVIFKGYIEGIAAGTGSVFSLIPPQNATGNWIKIVQRLPVRVRLDQEQIKKYPLRLGLSAYADVNISDKSGSSLTLQPTDKPIAHTSIYDIGTKEVDYLIQKIIEENLELH